MTPIAQFEAWRAELVDELAAASAELATARATAAAAQSAHREARDAWHALNAFAEGAIPKHGSISGPLHSRITGAREALTVAESARGAARAAVDGLGIREAELQLAIDQIDVALSAAKVRQLPRPATAPSGRKAAPVDFDDIEMPRGAAS